jgi:hypothetical protein
MSTTHDDMVSARVTGKHIMQPKAAVDNNSQTGGKDLSDAYL